MTGDARLRSKNVIRSWDEVPPFTTEAEEAAYWGEHSLGDELLQQMEDSPDETGLPAPRERDRAQPISVRIDKDTLDRLRKIARQRGVRYQSLLKQWLSERLALEEAQDRGGSESEDLAVPRDTQTLPPHAGVRFAATTLDVPVIAALTQQLSAVLATASKALAVPNLQSQEEVARLSASMQEAVSLTDFDVIGPFSTLGGLQGDYRLKFELVLIDRAYDDLGHRRGPLAPELPNLERAAARLLVQHDALIERLVEKGVLTVADRDAIAAAGQARLGRRQVGFLRVNDRDEWQ